MIYLGSDHGGFALKEKLKTWLTEWGFAFKDEGPAALDPEDDFPDYGFAVADEVGAYDRQSLPWKDRTKGILLCRSAAGMVIAANKVAGVRAAIGFDVKSAKQGRTNDDVNVLGLSGDWLDDNQAKEIVKTFLETEYPHEERHQRRLDKITAREQLSGGCCGGGGCGDGGCGGCGDDDGCEC